MTLDDKKQAIIQALQSKRYSANKINPESKGKYAGFLLKNQPVSDKQINKMYENLQALENGECNKVEHKAELDDNKVERAPRVCDNKVEQVEKESDEEKNTMQESIDQLQSKVLQLEATIAQLSLTITQLTKGNVVSNNKVIADNNKTDNKVVVNNNKTDNKVAGDCYVDGEVVLGFTIRQESTTTRFLLTGGQGMKTCVYKKYYAKRRIAGKLHRVYLGAMATKVEVEEKIKAHCQLYKIELCL